MYSPVDYYLRIGHVSFVRRRQILLIDYADHDTSFFRASDRGMYDPDPFAAVELINYCYRICVGRFLANDSLFLNLATVLWAANISAQQDEGGNPIIPDTLDAVPGMSMLVSSIIPSF